MSLLRLDSEGFISLAEEVLSKGDALRFQASGISMLPFIRNGDILEIKPIELQLPVPWDIILCTIPNGKLVAHRIVAVKQVGGHQEFLIQGDGLVEPDGYIEPENMLGKVVGVVHNSGYRRLDTDLMKLAARLWHFIAPAVRHFRWYVSKAKQYLVLDR